LSENYSRSYWDKFCFLMNINNFVGYSMYACLSQPYKCTIDYGICLLSTFLFCVFNLIIDLSYYQNLMLEYNLLFSILLWVFFQFENYQHLFKNFNIVKNKHEKALIMVLTLKFGIKFSLLLIIITQDLNFWKKIFNISYLPL